METIELIKRSRAGDKLAREQVIKANMPLVYSIVKRFAGRGYDAEDLSQIGAIGLIKAVDNFTRGRPQRRTAGPRSWGPSSGPENV